MHKVGRSKNGFRDVVQVETGESRNVKKDMAEAREAQRDADERADFPDLNHDPSPIDISGGSADGEVVVEPAPTGVIHSKEPADDAFDVVGDDLAEIEAGNASMLAKSEVVLEQLVAGLHSGNSNFAVSRIGGLILPEQVAQVRALEIDHPRGGGDGRGAVMAALAEAETAMGVVEMDATDL